MKKQLKIKPNEIILFLIIFLYLLSYRFFIFGEYQSIGHHWDFSFPISSQIIESGFNFFYPFQSIFHDFDILLYSTFISKIFLKLVISFDKYGIILFYFFIHLVSYFSLRYLFRFLKIQINIVASIFFIFSPYLFSTIIAGNFNGLLVYSVCPIIIVKILKIIDRFSSTDLLKLIFLNLIGVSSLSFYIQIIFFSVCYSFFVKKTNLSKIIKFCFILILINIWWFSLFFFPFEKIEISNISNLLSSNPFSSHIYNSHNIVLNFFGISFLDRNFYLNSTNYFFIFIYIVIISIFIIFFIKSKNQNKKFIIIFFSFLMIASVNLENHIFPNLKYFFFNLSFFNLFRSPQNLMFLQPLIFAFIISEFFQKKKNYLTQIVISILLTTTWSFSGDIGFKKLQKHYKKIGSVDYLKVDQNYVRTINYINNNFEYNSVIFYPHTVSPLFQNNEFQNESQGFVPEYLYLNPKVIYGEIDEINLNQKFLNSNNIKYIILRNDILFHHKKNKKKHLENLKFIKKLELEIKFGDFRIYKNPYFKNNNLICTQGLCESINLKKLQQLSFNLFKYNGFIAPKKSEILINGYKLKYFVFDNNKQAIFYTTEIIWCTLLILINICLVVLYGIFEKFKKKIKY